MGSSTRTTPRQRPILVAAGVVWLASRIPMFIALSVRSPQHGDVVTYRGWLRFFVAGGFPVADRRWQYPPGAAAVLSLPHLLPVSYVSAFLLLMLAADLAITGLLVAMARRHGSWLGCWCWLIGIPLLGSTSLGRFDLIPTLFAVLGIYLASHGAYRTAGAVAGLGAMIKIWPILVLAGLPRRHCSDALWAATIAGLLVGVGYEVLTRGSFSFLGNQASRGIEIESVAAVPFLLLHGVGLWHGTAHQQYGSVELAGFGVTVVAEALLLCSALALLALTFWRTRLTWHPAVTADAALVAALLTVSTSRVLSPQYLVWLLGAAGAALAMPRTSQRPVGLLIVLSAALTLFEFPFLFGNLVHFGGLGIAIVSLRGSLLLAATIVAGRRLWSSTLPPTHSNPTTANGRYLSPGGRGIQRDALPLHGSLTPRGR